MELTWQKIWWCLMQVPVRHWWQLFYNLRRLDLTYRVAREEGRTWMRWHLRDDGMIFISAWDETEAERRAKCALPDGFDKTPWLKLETRFDPDVLARLCAGLARDMTLAAILACGSAGLSFSGAGSSDPLALLAVSTDPDPP
ncbi:MAG: hypothetical protein WA989_17155 [Henriciella sp.]|uniref:hypothetical protein n=1 Tax=Henriciella sp. TaxID=1968823 RepID=UPI003C787D2C